MLGTRQNSGICGGTLFCFLLIAYLLHGTGLVSDDFVDLLRFRDWEFPELLVPRENFVNVPVGHLSHHIWFALFALDSTWVVDSFKIAFTFASLLMLTSFFRLFLNPQNALLVSLLFIFYPSHDSIPYWYAPSAHLFALALYFYAYRQADGERLVSAFILALIASFMVYGSTPTALALFALCLMQRKMKQGLVLFVPNLLYAAYFLYVSILSEQAPSRILEPVSASAVLKQFVLQLATYFDATFGPSMWLKLYLAMFEISLCSWLLGAGILLLSWRFYRLEDERYDKKLLACFALLALGSFAMFAVTGRYPQLAFNLGNRTTFWGSLLLAYLMVLLPLRKPLKVSLLGIFLFANLGISDHWRSWSDHQAVVLTNIRESAELKRLESGSLVFVSGNQYSRFGPISHIEFLSEDWVPRSIFALVLPQPLRVKSLNRNLEFQDGVLVNRKNKSRTPIGETLLVYDSEDDRLLELRADEMQGYLESLPEERRHWSQFGDEGALRWLKAWVVYLVPRLKYGL